VTIPAAVGGGNTATHADSLARAAVSDKEEEEGSATASASGRSWWNAVDGVSPKLWRGRNRPHVAPLLG
jgi:hypothetical protein